MYWNEAPNTSSVRMESWITDACENALDEDQRISGNPDIKAIASPTYIEFAYGKWRFPISMLLTGSNMVVGHKKGLGRRAEVIVWFRYDFLRFGVTHLGNVSIATLVHGTDGEIKMHFGTPDEAEHLAKYASSG